MNQNITQHNFSDGMANIPSDSICSDNSLAAEWNMIFKNGEHHVIRDPLPLYDGYENTHPYVLYIHKTGGAENAITLYNEKLSWLPYDVLETGNTELPSISDLDLTPESIKGITSIGNTLIVSVKITYEIEIGKWKHVNRLYYFLWKNNLNDYIFLGNQLPKPEVRFALNAHRAMTAIGTTTFNYSALAATSTADTGDMISVSDNTIVEVKKQEDFNNFIVGLYEKNKKSISQRKAFHSPFFVRYALELFDGSYARISAPILLFPSIRRNSYAEMRNYFKFHTTCAYLFYKNMVKIEDWSDIVKGIAVFVSKQIDVYETSVDQDYVYEYTSEDTLADGIFRATRNAEVLSPFTNSEQLYEKLTLPSYHSDRRFFSCLKQKDEAEILNELKSTSIFYKLFNIPLEATSNYVLSNDKFQTHDLENVVTLPQLDHDDYFGNCYLSSDVIYMYNRRLHLANVTRGFFEGQNMLCAFEYSSSPSVDIAVFVYIHANNGDRIIKHEYTTVFRPDFYFFYPDPRAYKVQIYRLNDISSSTNISLILEANLTVHPLLNGAYYMSDKLPTENNGIISSGGKTLPEVKDTPETLPNEVWQSEVNNPFVFNASGVITVGNGTIQSIISNTVALSQGQFGQFPLFVFTNEGIWTLQTSATGTYSTAQPMSREICNNKNTIVATDQLIFFSSTKGLMMINGSQITCVSTQMAGNTFDPTGDDAKLFFDYDVNPQMNFIEFLETCRIAYDYTESLLWIVNSKMPQCFVYSIESGAIAIKTLLYPIDNVINNYPDNLLLYHNEISDKEHEYYLASLLLRQNLNNDIRETSAFLISRPLKIEDATALKSLVEHKLIYNTNPNSQARIRVFGSDNMKDWSRINSFFGRGFKYFKYQLIFDKLLPTDTFSGIVAKWKTKFQRRFR